MCEQWQNNGYVNLSVGEMSCELQLENLGCSECKMDGISPTAGLNGKYLL